MRKSITSILCAALLLSATGCQKEPPQPDVPGSGGEGQVSVMLTLETDDPEEASDTKSSYTQTKSESSVGSITVLMTDGDGNVTKAYAAANSVALTLTAGKTYTFDVLANMGDLRTALAGHDQVMAYRHTVNNSDISKGGLPMYGNTTKSITAGMTSLSVNVERLLARYELRFNTSGVTSGTMKVKSVRMKNIAGVVSPTAFKAASASDIIADGDYSTDADISNLNSGKGVYFYVPENLQGTESGISSAAQKVPSYSFTTVNPNLCTYLEVTCSYSQNAAPSYSDDIVYRMYLGSNSTSDFNVRRNTKYTVTLQPIDVNTGVSWWKCEPKFNFDYELAVSPASASISVGAAAQFNVTWKKFLHGVLQEQRDVTSAASWAFASGSSYVTNNGGGKFTGKAAGTAYVQASCDGLSSSVIPITVSNVVSHTLELTPATASISVGGSQKFTAKYYTITNGVKDGGTDVTSSASWSSSNTSVTTVSAGTATGKAAGSSTITATYAGSSATATVSVSNVVTYSLEVSPTSASINVGEAKAFTARYYTITNGVKNAGTDVTSSASWSTSSSATATVSKGTVTGVKGGSATITATYSGASGSATVTVNDVKTYALVVTGGASSIDVGGTTQLKAMFYTYTNNQVTSQQDVTSSTTWSSASTAVATVSTAGKVTGVKAGQSVMTGRYNGYQDTWTVNVKDVVSYSLEVTPASASINVGGSQKLTAKYYTITNGVKNAGTDVTSSASWSSSSTSVATVSSGTVTGKAAGSATITATYSGKSATASITVSNVVTYSLEVTPASASINVGGSQKYTAKYYTITNGVKNSGTDVTSSASWSSSNTSVATVSAGTATGKAAGSATITATYSGKSATASLMVSNVVTYSLEISPASASIEINGTQKLTAKYYTITNGVKNAGQDVTSSASWSSSSTGIATVSAGTVTGKSAGSATITATYSGKSATASITVKQKTLTELYIDDTDIQIRVGDYRDFTAYARFSDGSEQAVSSLCTPMIPASTWGAYFSIEREIERIYVTGKAAVTRQPYTLSYTYNGVTKSATTYVTVTDAVSYRILISPTSASMFVGETKAFTVRREQITNGTVTRTDIVTSSCTFTSSNTSVATMSGGTATGKAPGTSIIKVSHSYNGTTYTAQASLTVNERTKRTVVSVTGTWKVTDMTYGSMMYINGYVPIGNTITNTVTRSGDTLVDINVPTNGHDETSYYMQETITYKLSDGTTHTYRSYTGWAGCMPGDDSDDIITISGTDIEPFEFHYILRAY